MREQRPFLGICLGAQMLAKQLGAKVAPHPEGRAQIGYYPIRPTPAGPARSARIGRIMSITGIARDLNCPMAPNCWRREAISRSKHFASSIRFGFQFHPDVTYAMMHRWTTRGHARLELPGARPRHHHFADRAVHDVTERAWLKQFLDGWLARAPMPAMLQAAE